MMENEFEKIEAFLNNEMNALEKKAFEEELLKNKSLAQRMELYRKIQTTLQASVLNKENEALLKQSIIQIHNDYTARDKKIIAIKKVNRWLIAAAAILIIAVSVYLLNNTGKPSTAELYAKYLSIQPLSVERGSSDSLLPRAVALYNAKRFSEASPLLQQYLVKDSSDEELQLAFYISKLQEGDTDEALGGFKKMSSKEGVFTNQARWYAALTYLKTGNSAACKEYLRLIPADADTYAQTQELLQQLAR